MFSSLFPLHSFFVSACLKLFRGVWVLFGASDRPRFPLDGNRTFHPPLSKRQSRHSFRWPGSFPFIAFRSPRPRIGFFDPRIPPLPEGRLPKRELFFKERKTFRPICWIGLSRFVPFGHLGRFFWFSLFRKNSFSHLTHRRSVSLFLDSHLHFRLRVFGKKRRNDSLKKRSSSYNRHIRWPLS